MQLLAYIQLTSENFTSNSNEEQQVLDSISQNTFDASLFNGIERGAIRYFFYLFNIDKHNVIYQRHNEIFDLRNSIAHLNYRLVSHDTFIHTVQQIENNLTDLSTYLYSKVTRQVFHCEISPLIAAGTIDDTNYQGYFDDINARYNLCTMDYMLCRKNKLGHSCTGRNEYGKYLKMYIEYILKLD